MPSGSPRTDGHPWPHRSGHAALPTLACPLGDGKLAARLASPRRCLCGEATNDRHESQGPWWCNSPDRCPAVLPLGCANARRRKGGLESVHTALLRTLNPTKGAMAMAHAGAAALEERWSYGGHKGPPRWSGQAIAPPPPGERSWPLSWGGVRLRWCGRGKPWEHPGGSHTIRRCLGASTRHRDPAEDTPGQRHTQQIERQHLTLRTRIHRLVRQTSCCSKATLMHAIVLGLFVNRYALERVV